MLATSAHSAFFADGKKSGRANTSSLFGFARARCVLFQEETELDKKLGGGWKKRGKKVLFLKFCL